jgi:SdpC family antimicrobial peptide
MVAADLNGGIRVKNWFAVPLVLVLACIACGGVDSSGGPDYPGASQPLPRYDGRALFEAFFFGQGEAAQRLPELWGTQKDISAPTLMSPESMSNILDATTSRMVEKGLDPSRAATLHKLAIQIRSAPAHVALEKRAARELQDGFRDLVTSKIAQRDPTFFARFGSRLQSGNPPQVEAALREGANDLLDASTDSGAGRVGEAPSAVSVAVARQIAEALYAVQAGAAWNVVGAYTVVAVALVVVFVLAIPVMESPEDSGLQRTEFIAKIADRFYVPSPSISAQLR